LPVGGRYAVHSPWSGQLHLRVAHLHVANEIALRGFRLPERTQSFLCFGPVRQRTFPVSSYTTMLNPSLDAYTIRRLQPNASLADGFCWLRFAGNPNMTSM
jgi:hypothetical protein